jgi:hypothetical protein
MSLGMSYEHRAAIAKQLKEECPRYGYMAVIG